MRAVATLVGRWHVLSVVAGRRRLTVVVMMSTTAPDDSDPATGVERLRARERRRRVRAGLLLGALAAVAAFTAAPLIGSPGATVGGVVAAIILSLLAIATWPSEWSDTERAHHELAFIWRQARADAGDEQVAWERCAAWAEPVGEEVELQLICCESIAGRVADAPSPFSRLIVRRLNAEDIEAAAEAMQQLRDEAAERERQARERHELDRVRADGRAYDEQLSAIDDQAAAELAAREQRLRREFAEQEAAERRMQAEAVARAIRRP